MTLPLILTFTVLALLVGFILPARIRSGVLLAATILAVYLLQPATPIRNLDFWLPTLAIGLTVCVWAITQTRPAAQTAPLPIAGRQPLSALLAPAGIILAAILALGLTRYIEPLAFLTPSRPPDLLRVGLALTLGGGAAFLIARFLPGRRWLVGVAIAVILLLFLILKTPSLAQAASAILRRLAGQDISLASALDLRWLGFSYLAFRLLHVLRDHQAGRLPACTLGEFATYALFFPAYTAGPIDRLPRFLIDLRQPDAGLERLSIGGQRILLGVFQKFVLADTLALMALNDQNAAQVHAAGWAWVLLYAYTLRIYFDFAGYTDIALGLAKLMGINLPENFDRPYLKTNLSAFWNSWHITLAQWFRAYVFNPLTRSLRLRPHPLPQWAIILIGQALLMLLIGLWHGVTWNFAAWGTWHTVGLFVHNRWSDWLRSRGPDLSARLAFGRLLAAGGWLLTFHYVALGWVWFALSTPALAGRVFAVLFGGG